MLARPMARTLRNTVMPLQAGYRLFDGRGVSTVSGDNVTIPIGAIVDGIVNRTGTSAATADVLPPVTAILAALPDLTRGDSISFFIRMALAHANTPTLGAGMTPSGTVNVAASSIREYLLILQSENKPTVTVTGSISTVAGQLRNLTNIRDADLRQVGVGMAVTGTGVGAGAKVVSVNFATRTVVVDVDSTATADLVSLTFTPQMTLFGVGTQGI